MSEREQPRLPIVGEYVRQYGRLVEIQDVTPPVVQVLDYIFERVEARAEARVNGKVVKTFGTFHEMYGIGTSVKNAIAECRTQQIFYGDSDMEFVVVKITSVCRCRPLERENFYAKEFRDFESLRHGCRWDLPDDVEEVVWSSKQEIANEQTS